MKGHQHAVQQDDFDALLGLFSNDREEAGRSYERLRAGLVRFFQFRGCSDAEALADETLNRVALKASGFHGSQDVKLTSYVYGFASNVFLEYARSPRHRELAIETDEFVQRLQAPPPGEDREPMFDCLRDCLGKLNERDRDLVIKYYSRDRRAKIELRKRLAESLGCRIEVLHTKVFRLKSGLKSCMSGCVEKI